MRPFQILFVVALAGCHSSCSEESGAEPVVVTDGGPILGQQHATPSVRPMTRRVMPLQPPSQDTD